ncbi:hypothetical protein GCM10009677_39510 [Sphaerisporangium rubeum]|uniref:Uncharacterized protein n=1 Tax=Sphaerisporangium rubeum TaxID=321317 RepID=A0A7X0IK73_9ACTN|nr:hypothetical protein [Sphaerisporangium rubeum]MBB6476711.1 hypothetical protein [Sphaerisporangium rubeum]
MSDVKKHAALLAVVAAMTGGLAGLSVAGAPSAGASAVMGGWGGWGGGDAYDGDGDGGLPTGVLLADTDDVDRADDVGEDGIGFGTDLGVGTGLGLGLLGGGDAGVVTDDVENTPARASVNGLEAVA